MTTISKSPDRGTFQLKTYLEKLEKNPNDETAQSMVEYYTKFNNNVDLQESNPDWQENNMEFDLRSCDWILEKVRSSDTYAQNLYAAMCNRDFIKRDVIPILKNQTWSCSWRYAGGIIADMRQSGDYIDWYCSSYNDTDGTKIYVEEGIVTEEIRQDLCKLGWIVTDPDN